MLDLALIALAIAVLSPNVLGPIIVRFTQRWPARPVFEPYDPIRHPLPDELAAAFRFAQKLCRSSVLYCWWD